MSEHQPVPGQEPSTSLRAERRACVRLESDLAAACRPGGRRRQPAWPGKVQDLSRGGAGLLLRHRFRPGTPLVIELREGTGRLLCTVAARVVHATAVLVEGTYCWLLGCAFEQPLSDEEFRSLV
jgi:hypothetical protein